ncbi:hypothetical protein, partial [Pseudoalteromonas marina]|uniref:hypothetical protein n=1 Tax=Pseudoalteromonas marina TaxID=267375 RepID=UPI003C415F8B
GTVTADGLTVDGASDLNGNVTIGSSITTLLTGNDIEFQRAGNSYLSQTGGGALSIRTNDGVSNKVRMNLASNGDISFYEDTGTTPKFFWDASAESLGIGTSSPSYPLEVQSGGVGTVLRAGTSFISIDSTGSAASPSLIFNGDDDTGIYRAASDTLVIATAGSERMRIDSSGNVGIGVTPESWNTYKTLQIGNGAIANYAPTHDMRVVSNAYYNSGWKYAESDGACLYLQDGDNSE